MQQAFVNINNVPTRVITWGKWIEESFQPEEPKDIIICIPGNPGLPGFYKEFLQTIHSKVGCPVWIVGHAGHEVPDNPSLYHLPDLQANGNLYGLQGQIEHKITFIDKYVPQDARIHLIGHSIGSYIILKLLKIPSIEKRVVKSYMMFPTIEHMAQTKNGKFLTSVIKRISWLLLLFCWLLSFLPQFMISSLVFVYLRIMFMSKTDEKVIMKFIDHSVVEKVLFMAYEEMDVVKTRDNEALEKYRHKCKFYYGKSDGWVPVTYYENLKKDFPDVDAELCSRSFEHAFVLRQSRPVANMVVSWIEAR